MTAKNTYGFLILTLFIMLFSGIASAQIHMYNGGVKIKITDNEKVYIKNGKYIHNGTDAINHRIQLTGEFKTDSGITLNASHGLFNHINSGPSFGKVIINGGKLDGSLGGKFIFSNLHLNSSSEIVLGANIDVYKELKFLSGNLDLKGQTANIYYSPSSKVTDNGEISGESESTYIKDSDSSGSVRTFYRFPFPNDSNLGNVGLKINTTGSTGMNITIDRKYGTQQPYKSFKNYYVLNPGSAIPFSSVTLSYLNGNRQAGSNSSQFKIFKAPTDTNSNYNPRFSIIDSSVKTVNTDSADLKGNASRLVIGECLVSPQVTLADYYSICENNKPLEIDARHPTHGANYMYQWYKNGVPIVPNGDSSTIQIDKNAPASGSTINFAVLVTDPVGGCFTYREFPITINPNPNTNFNLVDEKCEDRLLTFNNTTPNLPSGKFANSFWDFNLVNPGTMTQTDTTKINGTVTYADSGIFKVRLIMETDSGCKDTSIQTFNIRKNPVANVTAKDFELCANETFKFNNASTLAGPDKIYESNWYVDGLIIQTKSSVSALDSVFFNRITPIGPANRTETLMLITKSNFNCLDTITKTIQVRPLPVTNASATISPIRSPLNFCIDSTLSFQASTGKNVVSFRWDFGQTQTNTNNSGKITQQNPTGITYATAGNYTPKVHVASNLGCKDSFNTVSIVVHPLPIPDFSIKEDTVCYGTAIKLTNTKESNVTYNWEFGDSKTSSSQNASVSHSYTSSNVFNIKLKATSQYGCKNDSSKIVRIKPMPQVSFLVSDKCEDTLVSFTPTVISTPIGAPALNNPKYYWDFGELNANALNTPARNTLNPSIKFTKHSASLPFSPKFYTVSEKCTSITATNSLTIFPNPIAKFDGGNNCSGDAISFTNLSTIDSPGNNTFNWDMGDGNISRTDTGSFNYTYTNKTSKNYNLVLRATSNKGCIDDTTMIVRNYALPTAIFDTILATQCQNINSVFKNQSTMSDGSSMLYKWYFGNGDSSATKDPTLLYDTLGLYNVRLVARASDLGNPCSSQVVKQVPIHPIPDTKFSFSNNCDDDSIRFTNNTSIPDASAMTYRWNFNDAKGVQIIPNVSFKYNFDSPATRNVNLEVISNKNCTIQITKAVRFYALAFAKFDTSLASVCIYKTSAFANNSSMSNGGNLFYNWSFGDGDTSVIKDPSHRYNPSTPGFGIDQPFTVKLKVRPTDLTNVCRDSISKIIYMHPLPDSSYNLTLKTFCLGIKNSFVKNTAQNKYTYNWDFGNSNGANNTTFTQYVYPSPGNYITKLTSISEYNCLSTDTQHIKVLSMPSTNFTILEDTVCYLDTIKFTNTSDTVGNIYVWNYGDGSANDTSYLQTYHPKRVYAKANTYTVSLSATKGKCYKLVNKKITIEPQPAVQFSFKRDNIEGKKIQFTNTSYLKSGRNGSLFFDWKFGDGKMDTTAKSFFSHLYPGIGKYSVTLLATSNFGCKDSISDSISTATIPVSLFGISSSSVCKGSNVMFSNVSQNSQTYFWNFGDGTTSTTKSPNHTFSRSGKFLVQLIAKDTNNYSDTSSELISINPIPIVNFGSNTNVCAGKKVVFTNNSVIQSKEGLNYVWKYGDGDTSILQNPDHAYKSGSNFNVTLKVTSDSGCVYSLIKAVNVYPLPILNFDTANARTCAGTISSISNQSTIASGSISSYLWRFENDPSVSSTLNTSKLYPKAGQYKIELVAISNQGCRDSITKQVVIDSLPVLNFGGTQRTCGSSLTLDAKNPGATYKWSTSDTTKTITASSSGKYIVTVTLAGPNYCNAVDSLQVTLGSQVDPNLGTNFSSCGVTILDAKYPGSTYKWSRSSIDTNRTLKLTSTGTFKVTVTDQNNCVGIDSITVTIKSPPVVNLGSDVSVCNGIPVTLNAANSGNKFLWSNGDSTQTLTNPSAGFYVVKVTDTSTNCSTNDSVKVTYKASPSFYLGSDRVLCGTNSVLLNAGTFTNGTYLWTNNSTIQTFAINTSGTYWAKITDTINSCYGTDTVVVKISALPKISLAKNQSGCSGTSFTLDPGGSNGFNYLWNNNDTNRIQTPTSSGLFSVTVTDTNNCSNNTSSNITVYPSPTVNLGKDTNLCDGRSLLLSVGNPSYTVLWSNNSTSPAISAKSSGSYSVSATQSGCTSKDTVQVTFNAIPVVNLGSKSSICSNDTLTLDAGNIGSKFKWSVGDTTQKLSISKTGFYLVTVTDTNKCVGKANLNVQAYSAPKANLGGNVTSCQGINVLLNAKNPGATYVWSNSATKQAIQVTNSGTYKVTVTDQNKCTASDSSVINFTSKPVVNIGGNRQICSGKSLVLNANNIGLKFKWNTNDTTQILTASKGGIYQVTVANGTCVTQDQMVLSILPIPAVNLGLNKTGCTGDSISLTSLNNYPSGNTYNWSSGVTTRSTKIGITDTLILTVTDTKGCSNQDTVQVSILNRPTVNLGPNITACGDTLLDAGNTGASFLWNNNAKTQTIKANQNGSYIVNVSVSKCVSKDTIVVSINPLPVVNLGGDLTTCANNPPVLNAKHSGKKYLWSNGDTTQTTAPSIAGKFWVKVTDTMGCAGVDTVLVNFTAGAQVNLGNNLDTCHYQDITLDAKNTGSRYLWSNGNRTQTISVSKSGAYSVTVTDAKNCSDKSAINVTLNPLPILDLGADRKACDSLVLDGQNTGSSYLWNNASTAQKLTAKTAGTYWVKVTTSKTCNKTDSVTITVNPAPKVDLGKDTSICTGSTLTLNANNVGNTVLWSNKSKGQTISIGNFGTHWVKVTDAIGCSKSDTIKITLASSPTIKLGPDISFCINQEIELDAKNVGASYTWGGSNNLSDTSQKVIVKDAGKYYVKLTTAAGCVGSDTITLKANTDTVLVYFLSTSRVSIGDSVQFVDLSYPNIKTWNYNFGDLTSSTLQNPEHIYYVEGKYNVKLTVSNGTCSDSHSKEITVSKRKKVGKKVGSSAGSVQFLTQMEPSLFIKAKLYPNPNVGSFRLILELNQEDNVALYFFDMRGVIIHQEFVEGIESYVKNYRFENLAPGVYFMKAIVGRESKTFRVIISR